MIPSPQEPLSLAIPASPALGGEGPAEHYAYSHEAVSVLEKHGGNPRRYQRDIPRPVEIRSTRNLFSFTQEQPHPDISLVICNASLERAYNCSFSIEGEYALFTTLLSGQAECFLPATLHGRPNKGETLRLAAADAVGSFGNCAGSCSFSARQPLPEGGLPLAHIAEQVGYIRMVEEASKDAYH